MADMLKFRKGTYAQINAADKVAGTIYIAKDEKAMYVDVDASTRIRIGDFIRVDTVEGITPPYSTSALYYVENDNALLKYVETEHEGVKTGTWKQVNGTDDLKASITSLQSNMSQAKSDISTLKTDVGTLKTDVSNLKTTVGGKDSGLVKDVANLKAAIGMGADGTPEGIGSTVAQLVQDLDALEGTVGTQGETISEHTSKISVLETESAKHVTKTEAKAFAKTADIQPTLNKVDTEGTVTAAINAAVATEKSRAEAAEKALSNSLAEVKNTANSAVSNTAFESFKTANTTAINDAKTAAVSDATAAAKSYTNDEITKEVTRANGAYAPKSLVDVVAGHTSTLGILTNTDPTTVGSVAEAKKRADDAYTLAGQKTTMAEVEAKNYATKTEAQGYADAKDAAIKAAKDAAAAAKSAADDAQGDATKALADAAAANDNANTRVLISDFNKFKTTNSTAIADAKKAGTDAQATADANAGEIAKLKGAVGTAKKGTGDGTEGNDAATGLYKVIEDSNAALETKLSAEIDADIRAANAMEYAGTIESASGIPTSGVKNGATYVIGTSFGSYAAGDMLIAQGAENPDTGLIANPTWAHVKSGYDASLDQQLTGANNKIMLSNGVRNDEDAAGAITFAATGSASVAVANNTVTIGMVWEDFK